MPAQPVQFQSPGTSPPAVIQNNGLPTIGTPTFGTPSIINSPPIITTTPPASSFQQPAIIQQPGMMPTPSFDPFQTNNTPFPDFGASTNPSIQAFGSPQGNPSTVVLPQNIQVVPPMVQTPQFQNQQPQMQPNFQQPGFQSPGMQPYDINNQWPYGAPGSNWWPSSQWPSQTWAKLRDEWIPRVLERPRFRHTYISGNGSHGDEFGINESEVATTLTIPNFAGGRQPLRISPGFIWDFWSGPSTPVTGADLPAQAYSAYLATDYISDPSYDRGIESNIAIGIYTDFDNVSSKSWRITGTILGWQRVNSYSTAKLGIEYYDRVDIKLLPAVGVFMTPNPDLKLDIYFPRPKLAQRIPNWGNYEGWAYIGGEYGGGSWTIERLAGFDDQVDINDVRAFLGAEWVGPRNVTGFFEFGYVFERNLVYRSAPKTKVKIEDAFMIRTGVAF